MLLSKQNSVVFTLDISCYVVILWEFTESLVNLTRAEFDYTEFDQELIILKKNIARRPGGFHFAISL